jgi:type IX secretion system PorP/SprF family membrane protein
MNKYLNKIFVAFLISVAFLQFDKAQQLGIYSNYLLNEYYYNPAVAGTRDVFLANLNYRNQWVGFNEAPRSYMASVYGSWKGKRKVGLGANVTAERAGLIQKTGVYATYAYHFAFTEKLRLGLGVSGGYQQYRIRLYDVRVVDNGDDMLTGNVLNAGAPDMNAGFYLYHDKFWLGASGFQLLNSKLNFASSNSKLTAHYYASAGVNLKINKKNIIQPSFLLRMNQPLPYQVDASLRWMYDKKFWAGLSYRTDDSYCVLAGFNYKDLINIGYSFDYPFNGLQKYSSGSHEIWLSWTMNKKKKTLDEQDEEINNSVHDLFKQKQKEK